MMRKRTPEELAEMLLLPPEALPGAERVTVQGRGCAVVENHRGVLGYDPGMVEVRLLRGRVRILGRELVIRAMDTRTLIVTGQIAAVEYG